MFYNARVPELEELIEVAKEEIDLVSSMLVDKVRHKELNEETTKRFLLKIINESQQLGRLEAEKYMRGDGK